MNAQLLPGAEPALSATEAQLKASEDFEFILGKAVQFREAADWKRYAWAMERALELRPYNFIFQFELARAYALQDEKQKAYDRLIKMQQQGFAFTTADNPDFEKVRGTEVYDYIEKNLQANVPAFGEGKVAFTVQDGPELLESLSYSKLMDRFLMGSLKTGQILAVERNGKSRVLIEPDDQNKLQSVTALAVSTDGKTLYATTAATSTFPGATPTDAVHAALLSFELPSGKLIKRHALPFDGQPQLPASLAIAPDGTVYIADAVRPQIHRLKDGKVERMVAAPALTSLRGLAVSGDGKRLFVADYELGLIGMLIGSEELYQLTAGQHNLGGIEGLLWHGEHLYAVQNAFPPSRLVRIVTAQGGAELKGIQPLEANQPQLSMPTVGVAVGDDYYYIANSQRDSYGPSGKIADGEKVEARRIWRSSLKFNSGPLRSPQLQDIAPAR
ncbi:MAG: hypothetical protein MUE46_00755 [Xanthomonadales bacterium]|nr:hypothetical protein [Xanthomonadales bacterium]